MAQLAPSTTDIFAAARADVRRVLHEYCQAQIKRAAVQGDDYQVLWESIGRLLDIGGKYMRPYLVMQSYQMYGGINHEGALAAAAAHELLHVSMLIHDDIIDRDEVRYGIDNIAGQYRKKYQGRMSQADVDHYSASAALLAGDVLISGSYEMILNSSLSDSEKVVAAREVASSIFSVVGGEMEDSESVLKGFTDVDALAIAAHKTAAYSFVGPLATGALLAGAPEADISSLRNYGLNLGIAFQLADDLLGVFGDEAVTGKSNLSDIREGKRTYLMQQTFLRCGEQERAELESIVGRTDATDTEVERVRAIIVSCGADAATRLCITEYAQKAEHALGGLSCPETSKQPLRDLLHKATERDK